jgi:hypothetical protein
MLTDVLIPVALPPGRLKLAIRPARTGSVPKLKMIGMTALAALAASGEGSPPTALITATLRLTKSAARAGKRPYSPRAQRNSIATFWPSTKAPSLRARRYASTRCADSSGARALRNPITGLAGLRRTRS